MSCNNYNGIVSIEEFDAYTGNYEVEKGYESQRSGYRTAQEAYYTGWYGQEKAQEAVRSRNRTVRDTSGTVRQVRYDYWHH